MEPTDGPQPDAAALSSTHGGSGGGGGSRGPWSGSAPDQRQLDRRVSKAVKEEEAFLEYIASLPAMSTENVEAFKRKEAPEATPLECAGGLEHLDNLYKLMEHLGRLRRQNSKLQKRLRYLESVEPEPDFEELRARKLSGKAKALMRTVSKDDATTNVKSKVSKWTKVKEAFRWERVLLPEAASVSASQDSGLGLLRPPSDHSSFSVSPADSLFSASGAPPRLTSSLSTSEDELELDISDSGQKRRRLSMEKNVHLGVDDDETRRSKSLDGDSSESTCCLSDLHQQLSKDNRSCQMSQKAHKTPWSKVKDIIQTRTGSIKKKKGTDTDVDDEGPGDFLDPEEKDYENEEAVDPNSEQSQIVNCNHNKKRLAPVLTITLPSTEELRSTEYKTDTNSITTTNKNGKPPPSPQVEDKHNRMLIRQRTMEELTSKDHCRKQVSSSSAGTSPPTPRRKSKWSKVKNAFLTSTPSPEELTAHFSNSTPSSPVNKSTSFLYDLESDELSSSEFIDENQQDNNDNVFIESPEGQFNAAHGVKNLQVNTQRNLENLHLRFSKEFHQKLSEWERIRDSGVKICSPPSAGKVSASGLSSGTSSVGEEEKTSKRRGDEWDKIKSTKKRESLALQQLDEENLSPDFKKKLEQWERIKAVPVSPTQESSPVLQPQSKRKITDWQRWRPGSSSTKNDNHSHNISPEIPDEFSKRLLDWDRIKHGPTDCDASVKAGNRTPSPGVSYDISFEQKSRRIHHRLSETKERWTDTGHKIPKSKSHHEIKELAWLEKELHKIEREKQRLERERDKYLEREARLQKMKRAIGSTQQKQEVVIPTSTGLFRFEGISQKFTKKLYEWEKARGIGPEASTIALLDPGYKPPNDVLIRGENFKKNGTILLRSKSMGSVVDIPGGGGFPTSVITHQPSSLSLINMEEIGNSQISSQDVHIDMGSCLSDKEDEYEDYYDGDEPGAVIVDIEDVVEETASPLAEPPVVLTEIPVYCYAPAEVTRLIDSSGSENELSSGNVQSSYCILQENIDLLDELKKKEDICRRIGIRMENLEEKIQSTASHREKQLESLAIDNQDINENAREEEVTELQNIKSQLKMLEDHQEALKHEEETLQFSFVEHSEQQAVLAQSLVDNMRQLQEVNNCMSSKEAPNSSSGKYDSNRHEEALARVQELTIQLLTMAERLEIIVGERNRELWRLRETLISPRNTKCLALSQHSQSTDSITASSEASTVSRIPRQSSEELSQLPTMLTSKVLELKRGLSYICAVSDAEMKTVSRVSNRNDSQLQDFHSNRVPSLTERLRLSDREEREAESKSDHEGDQLVVACLTLPSLKNGDDSEFEDERPRLKIDPSESNQIDRSWEIGLDSVVKNNDGVMECKSLEDKFKTDEMCLKNKKQRVCGSEPQSKKEGIIQIDIQTSKDKPGKITRIKKSESNGVEFESTETDKTNFTLKGGRMRRGANDGAGLSNSEDKRKGNFSSPLRKPSNESSERKACLPIELQITEPMEGSSNQQNKSNQSEKLNNVVNPKQSLDGKSTPESLPIKENVYRSSEKIPMSGINQSVPVDVFVPTTRKIFSPVRRDSKGKTSSVISYIVRENAPSEKVSLSPRQLRRNDEPEDDDKSQKRKRIGGAESKKDEINFVMPPCWILRETRAQSASPALQRRNFLVQKEKPMNVNSFEKKNEDGGSNEPSTRMLSENVPGSLDKHFDKIENQDEGSIMPNSKCDAYEPSNISLCENDPAPKKETLPDEFITDKQNSHEVKIQSIRKCRTEMGFPPISPIPGRKEVKLVKEAAPSIRMIIARYNQKVSESQEIIGTKSPDSGSGSPLPWRSPGAERRVRAQMEKYQDEVSRVLQGNEVRKPNCCGEVKKSASASFIRSSEKGVLQDCFDRRPSESLSEKQASGIRYNGILKSSSAGSIKPGTPASQRQGIISSEDEKSTKNIPPVLVKEAATPEKDILMNTKGSLGEVCTSNTYVGDSKSIGSRASRIRKAKEEFLLRGPGGNTWSTDCQSDTKIIQKSPAIRVGNWSQENSRLSQVSCGSEGSCEGILVSGEEQRQTFDTRLLVKSASASMINIDPLSFGSMLPESTSNSSVPSGSSEQGAGTSKSKFGFSNIASRFRRVKMRRHREKDKEKMETVSTLCRQSLLVDIQKRKPADKIEKLSSKSCPSSPVLHKRESNSSWSISPRRIFKPK